jgi:hypothetical protein
MIVYKDYILNKIIKKKILISIPRKHDAIVTTTISIKMFRQKKKMAIIKLSIKKLLLKSTSVSKINHDYVHHLEYLPKIPVLKETQDSY